jgi:hypothetical protein
MTQLEGLRSTCNISIAKPSLGSAGAHLFSWRTGRHLGLRVREWALRGLAHLHTKPTLLGLEVSKECRKHKSEKIMGDPVPGSPSKLHPLCSCLGDLQTLKTVTLPLGMWSSQAFALGAKKVVSFQLTRLP